MRCAIHREQHYGIAHARYTIYMLTRHAHGPTTWIDLENPSTEELTLVREEFNIDPRIEEELTKPTPYPIQVSGADYLYLVLHFPTTDPAGGAKSQEVDLIIGKHFLITSRYEAIESIHGLHRVFEAEELLGLPAKGVHADVLLERVLQHLYGAISEEAQTIMHRLERIEKDVFSGRERQTVRAISDVGRVLLRFDTTLSRHAELLPYFLRELEHREFFGENFAVRAGHLEALREHVAGVIRSYREVASELRITNDSLLSASQNEVMKTLTVISFAVLPSTLLVSFFQMNIGGIPFQHEAWAFYIVLALAFMISVGFIVFSKKKGWI